METELQKQIDERIRKLVPEILKGSAFTDRKLTDTPIDSLSVVPRKYVTMNGSVAGRPSGSVIGQFYFNLNESIPMWRIPDGRWVNSSGSVIAQA